MIAHRRTPLPGRDREGRRMDHEVSFAPYVLAGLRCVRMLMLVIWKEVRQELGVYWLLGEDGQFVQYFVLYIAHMPLYQSGIAGRFWRNVVSSWVITDWYAAVFVDSVLSSFCVRF